MGVNSTILLSSDTRLRDATDVIGILAGLKAEKQPLSADSYSVRVRGAKAISTSVVEMAMIIIEGDLVDGEANHQTSWHWESDEGDGKRLLLPTASGFWIAIGRRLVDFFGGSIVYCDYDNKPNYRKPKPRKSNCPSDGKPWHSFQDEQLALKPITQADIVLANQWAAYKTNIRTLATT